jgi:hypothetical protein
MRNSRTSVTLPYALAVSSYPGVQLNAQQELHLVFPA